METRRFLRDAKLREPIRSRTLTLALLVLVACSSSEDGPSTVGTGPPNPTAVGPGGGLVSNAGVDVQIPPGALLADLPVAITQLASTAVAAPRSVLLPDMVGALEVTTSMFAFTPHGTQFQMPVTIVLPDPQGGQVVLRLDDESDTTWEPVDGAVFNAGKATFQVRGFSVYAVARFTPTGGPDNDPRDPMPGPSDGGPIASKEGEHVVDVHDSSTRGYGNDRIVFDGGHLHWTRDQEGKLSIFSSDLRGAVPVQPTLIFEAPFAASDGWSNPPLLPTSQHLVLPVIGVIDLGSGPVESDGWATLRKDGTDFRLGVLDNWWVVARQESVIKENFYTDADLVSLVDGTTTPLVDFRRLSHDTSCVYDPAADEIGCLGHGIVAYAFKSPGLRSVSDSIAIQGPRFGSTRLAFNTTHWFAPVSLPSGEGIGAFARNGGSATKYHEGIDAFGPVKADDNHLYACLAGALTRISLADDTRVVLAEDCGDARGMSIVGMDASYLYYIHKSKSDLDYPRVSGKTIAIHRIAK